MTSFRWYHGANLLLGTGLLLYPTLLGLDGAARVITYGAGALIVLSAAWALAQPPARSALWIMLFAGVGAFFAPGFVGGGTGFPPRAAAAVWLTSLLVVLCARIGLQRRHRLPRAQPHAPQRTDRPAVSDPRPIAAPGRPPTSEQPLRPRSVDSIH